MSSSSLEPKRPSIFNSKRSSPEKQPDIQASPAPKRHPLKEQTNTSTKKKRGGSIFSAKRPSVSVMSNDESERL